MNWETATFTCPSTSWKSTSAYPTLRVMQHLHRHKGQYDYIPGGVESMIVYSYFHKGGGIPKNRTERDLRVLRNTVFPAGSDLPDQLGVNAEVTEGISTHLRSTLRRLREITVLPSIDRLGDMTAETLDERQTEIDALIGLYSDQITKDYQACRLDKERIILLSHLSQEQSMEVLEVHLHLARHGIKSDSREKERRSGDDAQNERDGKAHM